MPVKDIRNKIKKCSLEQLGALRVFTLYNPPIVTAKQVSKSISSSDQSLGGLISSLSRIKTEQGPLIEPAGRDEESDIRWRLNELVITKEELAELISQLLGKDLQWAENPIKQKKVPISKRPLPIGQNKP
ncbi:hypothetical protein ACFLZP_03980 [Patescibacteria group bacterium]